jgi:NAD(P)-dependent dehydrogenase (short-subunit alcohol dehydrogenase family)
MTAKTIVITGASNGIGAAAARRLNRSGDKVVVVGRSQSKTIAVAAPFLLTTELLDVLVESRATVVNTTSSSHKLLRRVSVDAIENTARRSPAIAYALTKMAIVLFTRELHRRHGAGGLSAATFHPGNVNSNIGKSSGSRFLVFMQRYTPTALFTATTDEGADQLVWLASSTPGVDWTSGEYYAKHRIAKANRAAYDPRLAGELWDRTLARIT